MTTENDTEVISKPRDLTDLLALKSFQGMTDEEIEIVIAFRENNARKDELTKAQMQSQIVNLNAAADEYVRVASEGTAILKQLLHKELKLGTIEDSDATEVSANE